MAIWLDEDSCKRIKKIVNEKWPDKRVKIVCRAHSWQSSRYVQISTVIKDMDIHYEYLQGHVQLHFEGKFTSDEFRPLFWHMQNAIHSEDEIQWRQCGGVTRGLCGIDHEIDTWEDFTASLAHLINMCDPVIQQFVNNNPTMFPNQKVREPIPKLSYKLQGSTGCHAPKPTIQTIAELEFDKFVIPPYQRPYKWTAKNVNQLISDVRLFSDKQHYRLGSLVLFNNEIVDGQQRIVTLTLLIKTIYANLCDKEKKDYSEFIKKLSVFSDRTSFSNRYSLHNVVENFRVIEERKNDFDDKFFDFLLNKCEFVVIQLSDISEAFQFFDSQNARGKDLEAHDLLKAYHLREMSDMSAADSANIDMWQRQRTEFLKEVFRTLYRAKQWPFGKSARYFTKSETDVFKGISLKGGKRYPFYQLEVIAHIFCDAYSNATLGYVDHNDLEYPFNLDSQIINGSRFFDLIRHYMDLYSTVLKIDTYLESGTAREIIDCIESYDGKDRTGDQYVRSMFNTLILYYVDRFGMEELAKVVPSFFIWAYKLRLENPAVQLASADNYARVDNSMFRQVHDAKTPYDIINVSQKGVRSIKCTKCDKIVEKFKQLNKIYADD